MPAAYMPRRLRRDPTGDGRDLAPPFSLEASGFGPCQLSHFRAPSRVGFIRDPVNSRAGDDVFLRREAELFQFEKRRIGQISRRTKLSARFGTRWILVHARCSDRPQTSAQQCSRHLSMPRMPHASNGMIESELN
jgi:hypothetical protein